MKGDFLPVGLAFISICLTGNFPFRIFLTVLWLIIFNLIKPKDQRLAVSFLLILLLMASVPLKGSHIYSGSVDTIRDNYLIVRDGLNRVMVYYDGPADLDDVIIIDQDIEPLGGYDNFDISTFSSWAKGNNIIGQLTINHYDIERPSSSLRHLIRQYNQKEGREWISQLLFGSGLEVDSGYRYLIIQSSLHISFLASLIKRVLSWFFYQRKATALTIAIMGVLALILNFPFGYLRVLVSLIAGYLIEDRRNGLAFQIIVLCLIKPYYVNSLSFLVPIGLKLIGVFSHYRHPQVNILFLTIVQLYFYGYVNLFSVVCFRLFSRFAGCLYLLALVFALMPLAPDLSGIMNWYLRLAEKLPIFNLTGRLSFLIAAVCLFLLFRYLGNQRKVNLILILLIILLNCHKRLLCPFYVITQLDVGQGDCCLICFPFSTHGLLIDAAGNPYRSLADEIIAPYLYGQGIRSLDVIITHEDYDHNGSLARLKELINVKKVYDQKQQVITCNGLMIHDPLYDERYEEGNDGSLISLFAIDQFRFLYTGDVSWKVESDLVDRYGQLEVDVLKVSHHGSVSATSEKLLASLRPDIALISAGKNNYYDHPHPQVVERLENFGVRIYSTKQAGAIRMIVMRGVMLIMQPQGQIAVYRH